MAHHVYNTQGFIIESIHSGEANKFYTIFTRELGMIRATAQGVRLLKSKLRFSLQEFSHVHLSIVRGKEIWRITNAKSESNLFSTHKHQKEIVYVLAQIFSLLKRLIPGEEKNEHLFSVLHEAFEFLRTSQVSYETEDIQAFERILVINILHNLGYMGNISSLVPFFGAPWSQTLLEEMKKYKKSALQEINRAIKATQL